MDHLNKKIVLNIGSGKSSVKSYTKYFDEWKEIRGDIAEVNPDVITDIRTLENIEDLSVDAIWASHVIEHCYWHEQPMIFRSILRVLKNDGFAVVKVPDIGSIADKIKNNLLDPVYVLENGQHITALDILYGYRPALDPTNINNYNPAMAHKMGFNIELIKEILHYLTTNKLKINGMINSVNYEITLVIWKDIKPVELFNYIS